MKRQYEKTTQYFAALMLGVLLTLGSVAQAANNQGFGDVAGDTNALGNSNIFVLNSSGVLTLVKTAWLTADGTPITSTTTVPAGTQVDFMIYVNNKSDLQIDDVTIRDTLDLLFSYNAPDDIRVDNAVVECALTACTVIEQQAIYDAAILVGAGTDAVSGVDSVSYTGTSVNVGNANEANAQQNAAANSVLAVVFTVTVQ
ncbi:MAG: hypothetical protein DRI30_06345 [Chloroflexi bacterium]|nr:MAG: hypothetical protein DRI30_06345 [Chloroflexota bacterium]